MAASMRRISDHPHQRAQADGKNETCVTHSLQIGWDVTLLDFQEFKALIFAAVQKGPYASAFSII